MANAWIAVVDNRKTFGVHTLLSNKDTKRLYSATSAFSKLIIFGTFISIAAHLLIGDLFTIYNFKNILCMVVSVIIVFEWTATETLMYVIFKSWKKALRTLLEKHLQKKNESLEECITDMSRLYRILLENANFANTVFNPTLIICSIIILPILIFNWYILVIVWWADVYVNIALEVRTYTIMIMIVFSMVRVERLHNVVSNSLCFS